MKTVSILLVGVLIAASANAADVVSTAASGVAANKAVAKSTAVAASKAVVAGKPAVAATGIAIGNAGDKEFPSGTPVIPPKPKKEELEGAAIKAKAGMAKP